MKTAWKVFIVVILVIVVGVVMIAKNRPSPTVQEDKTVSPEPSSAAPSKTTPTVNSNESQAAERLPRLVDLGADKCIPCKMMAPILEELKESYQGRLDVVFIDVWKKPDDAKKYNIKLIPTQIFFDAAGRELFRHEGFFSKEDILGKWKEFGVNLEQGTNHENQ